MDAEIPARFVAQDTSDFPDFYGYQTTLEMGLWTLWVAKDKLGIRKLTAEEIASVIRDVKEISINSKSITKSFNRAADKVHTYQDGERSYYEIMKPGKDYLLARAGEGSVEVFYFEPGRRYTSKRILSKNILGNLEGELKIVDPYCGARTLDILKDVTGRTVKFLTRLENLGDKRRKRFLREARDFLSECPNIEFRDYSGTDIHDRYVISSQFLVVLGHSIKDLGGKESFAIVLNKDASKDLVAVLTQSFDRRWEQSEAL